MCKTHTSSNILQNEQLVLFNCKTRFRYGRERAFRSFLDVEGPGGGPNRQRQGHTRKSSVPLLWGVAVGGRCCTAPPRSACARRAEEPTEQGKKCGVGHAAPGAPAPQRPREAAACSLECARCRATLPGCHEPWKHMTRCVTSKPVKNS